MGDRVEFVWRDEARFKHLRSESAPELAALTSFGIAVGSYLLDALPAVPAPAIDPRTLRAALLEVDPWIGLSGLLAVSWQLGIPVIHLRVFPLATKSMQAMVVSHKGRHAILLGRDASYPAPIAFTLAHELGHIALGHLSGAPALVDFETEDEDELDAQEVAADRYALELLTGEADPQVDPGAARFNAQALAGAAVAAGTRHRVEPGTLALVLAHRQGCWAVANEALVEIYDRPRPMWAEVNRVAAEQLEPAALDADGAEFLGRVMGRP
jgi:hypothetical protein